MGGSVRPRRRCFGRHMLKVIAISCTLLSLLTRADQAGGDDEGDAANTNAEAEDVVTEDSASSGKRWTVTAPVSCDSVIQNTGAAVFKSAALLSLIALAGEMGVDMVDEYAPQGNPRFDDAWETIFTRSFQIIGVLRRVAIGMALVGGMWHLGQVYKRRRKKPCEQKNDRRRRRHAGKFGGDTSGTDDTSAGAYKNNQPSGIERVEQEAPL